MADDIRLGGAYVEVEYRHAEESGRKAVMDFERGMRRGSGNLDRAGADAGDRYVKGFDTTLGRNSDRIGRDTGRKVGDGFAKGSKPGFDLGAKAGAVAIGGLVPLAATAATATAATFGAMGLAVAGLGAMVAHQNAEVAASFNTTWREITAGVKESTAPMVPYLKSIAEQGSAAFREMRPELDRLFTNAGPQLQVLADGFFGMTSNLLPGFNRAMEQSGHAVQGLNSLMKDAGKGAGEFLENLSEGGERSQQSLESIGRVVRGLLSDLGAGISFLSGVYSEVSGTFESLVDNTSNFVGELGSGFFGVAIPAAQGLLSTVTGLMKGLEPVAPIIGGIGAAWLTWKLAVPLVSGLSSMISGFGERVAAAGTSMIGWGTTATTAGKAASGFGGFLQKLGNNVPLVGFAVAGLGLVLDHFISSSSKSETATRDLDAALRQSKGAWDQSATSALKASLEAKGVTDALDNAKVSQLDYMRAITEGGPALDSMRDQLRAYVTELDQNAKVNAKTGLVTRDARAIATEAAIKEMEASAALAAKQRELSDAQRSLAAVTTSSAKPVSAAAQEMGTAIDAMGDKTAKVNGLYSAIRKLLDSTLLPRKGIDDARAAMEEFVDTIGEKLNKGLVNARGEFDLTSKKGRELREAMLEGGKSMGDLGQAVYDAAIKMGKAPAQARQESEAAMTNFARQFEEIGKKAGLSKDQIAGVMREAGLLPKEIAPKFSIAGLDPALRGLAGVNEALKALPPGVAVEVKADTVPPQKDLEKLGLTVTNLPNGMISIMAKDEHARAKLDAYLALVNGSMGTASINGNRTLADAVLSGLITHVDSSRGTVTIGGNAYPANEVTARAIDYINRSKGTLTVQAAVAQAEQAINYAARNRTVSIFGRYIGPSTRSSDYYGGAGAKTGGLLGFGGQGVAVRRSFDSGGVTPGFTPGRDVHTFVSPTGGTLSLSGGEAVMRPEWVRWIGQEQVHRWNRQAASGALSSSPGRSSGAFTGSGSSDMGVMVSALLKAIQDLGTSLFGARFQMDPDGVTRLVNNTNLSNRSSR